MIIGTLKVNTPLQEKAHTHTLSVLTAIFPGYLWLSQETAHKRDMACKEIAVTQV